MAWCNQASSHYLGQYWPRFMSPYGITRPQWVNISSVHATLLMPWVDSFRLIFIMGIPILVRWHLEWMQQSCFTIIFPLAVSSPHNVYKLISRTTNCRLLAIFYKYCCYIKYVGIITNLTLRNHWGYITDMSKCHGAGVWIRTFFVLCSKTYSTLGGLFCTPTASRRAAGRACISETPLLILYWINIDYNSIEYYW